MALSFTISELLLGPVPMTTSSVAAITTGPDNNIWLARVTTLSPAPNTFQFATTIDRVGLDGTVTELVTIPDAAGFPSGSQLTTGPDGNLWLSLPDNYTLTRITLAGVATSFKIPESPYGLVTGPDNNLWFTGTTKPTGGWNPLNQGLQGTPVVGRYTLPTDANPNGTVTEFTAGLSGIPGPMIAGPDGNLWFTEPTVQKIGRVTPSGIITEFPIGSSPFPGGLDITAGPDGNVWFTDEPLNIVGRITPAGAMTEFAVPEYQAGLSGITTGPDGNLWFTESFANKIGHMDPSGKILDELPIPDAMFYVGPITAGPDGTVVFTQMSFDYPSRIGVVSRDSATGSITGTVFQDFNRSGQQDANEPGLLGQTVFLDLNHSGTLDAGDPVAVTDSNGFYRFPAVPAGVYTVRHLVTPADSQDSPPALGGYTVTVVAGANQANVDFADPATLTTVTGPAPQNLFGGSNLEPQKALPIFSLHGPELPPATVPRAVNPPDARPSPIAAVLSSSLITLPTEATALLLLSHLPGGLPPLAVPTSPVPTLPVGVAGNSAVGGPRVKSVPSISLMGTNIVGGGDDLGVSDHLSDSVFILLADAAADVACDHE